jgi:L-cystine transport system ATP-binding protein
MIALEHIQKRFGALEVLHDVSLKFAEGSVTAIIGPSGSGKSTLLRTINLLEVPTSGAVEIGDQRIVFTPKTRPDRKSVLALRRQTGMIFQSFQLFPHRTAAENVMEGLVAVQGWDKGKARARALELLDKVGLSAKADAWPSELSGGQQQRVAIARALAPSPKVLLCDEPTSALDPELAEEVVEVLVALAKEGTTMILATHDLRLAQTTAQTVVFIDQGAVVETGNPAEIFANPQQARTARFIATLRAA